MQMWWKAIVRQIPEAQGTGPGGLWLLTMFHGEERHPLRDGGRVDADVYDGIRHIPVDYQTCIIDF